MPELPEVQTVVNELNSKLKNRVISKVQVNAPKLIGFGSKTLSPKRTTNASTLEKFQSTLKDAKILSVRRRAKLLIFDIEGPWSMLVHLKMTGQFIFEDEKLRKITGGKYKILNRKTAPLVQMPCPYTHVIFYFKDNSILYFNDVRKFGYLKLVHDNDIKNVKELNDFGPEPLDENFTSFQFVTAVTKRKQSQIKQVIMDNKVVVGIGNIYSDEILFFAKVRPTRLVKTLTKKELEAIFKNIVPVLQKGIETKGSSVGDFVRTDGSWGDMGKYHYVYGRKGQECKVCKTKIVSTKVAGRTGSFCPKCQK